MAPEAEVPIWAGETVVTVRGEGSGGRNQEAALAAALVLEGQEGRFLSFGTDGIDGPTAVAGALVDNGTIQRARRRDLDSVRALDDNDSYDVLGAARALIRCGPTGTNVSDLWLVDRRPSAMLT